MSDRFDKFRQHWEDGYLKDPLLRLESSVIKFICSFTHCFTGGMTPSSQWGRLQRFPCVGWAETWRRNVYTSLMCSPQRCSSLSFQPREEACSFCAHLSCPPSLCILLCFVGRSPLTLYNRWLKNALPQKLQIW